MVRVLSGGAGLLGAHHGLGPAWCADRVLLHPKGVGRGAFGGGVGKGVSRPNGIRRGRVQRGRRRSPTGGPKTLPSPVEPAGGARGLAAPETLRASAPNATDRIGLRGEPGQPQVPRTVGQVPCTAANQEHARTPTRRTALAPPRGRMATRPPSIAHLRSHVFRCRTESAALRRHFGSRPILRVSWRSGGGAGRKHRSFSALGRIGRGMNGRTEVGNRFLLQEVGAELE